MSAGYRRASASHGETQLILALGDWPKWLIDVPNNTEADQIIEAMEGRR